MLTKFRVQPGFSFSNHEHIIENEAYGQLRLKEKERSEIVFMFCL